MHQMRISIVYIFSNAQAKKIGIPKKIPKIDFCEWSQIRQG
jgi:hypothetical protein